MANLLEGLQFAELKSTLSAWNEDNYTDWQDITDQVTFHTGTKFRVKPVYEYAVLSNGVLMGKSPSKNQGMAVVARLLDENKHAEIFKHERTAATVTTFLSENSIQFKHDGADRWTHPQYFSSGAVLNSRIHFRKMPDCYWSVAIKTGIAQSTLTFDDVEELDKYISKQLRTSDSSISIARVAYV